MVPAVKPGVVWLATVCTATGRPAPGLQVLAAAPDVSQLPVIEVMRRSGVNRTPLLEHDPALLQRKMELVLEGIPSDPQLYALLEDLRPLASTRSGILQPAWAVSQACVLAWHVGLYPEVSGRPVVGSTSGFMCFAAPWAWKRTGEPACLARPQ